MDVMSDKEPLSFKDREQWRSWLTENHDKSKGAWLLFYKKRLGKQHLLYEEAVEEALCFGWIDSRIRRIDDEKHMQRYTPRNPKSIWSDSNRKRAGKLIKEGRMTEHGLRAINASKRNGRWRDIYTTRDPIDVPEDLEKALLKDPEAHRNFHAFAPSYRLIYIYWVNEAKREETRKRRMDEVVKRSRRGLKPGID